jgi:diguanylate cyclase (GGDEF)-like protein
MACSRRRLTLAALVVLSLAGLGCGADAGAVAVHSLAGDWAFRPGDDPRFADPALDDSAWTRLAVPRSWGRQGFGDVFGYAWYRLRTPVPWPADVPLGLRIGSVESAYEVYAGGIRIGGVGRLPPDPSIAYDRHGVYLIPSRARSADGSVTLALRVWRAPGVDAGSAGPVEGAFEIGPLAFIVQREARSETAQLILAFVLLAAAVYHLVLGVQRRSSPEYLWFAIAVACAALYGFLRTQWRFDLPADFVTLKKAEHLLLYLIPACSLQFLWLFFHEPLARRARLTQAVLLGCGAIVVLAPGLIVARRFLPILYLIVAGLTVAVARLVLRRVRAGDPEAGTVGVGALLVATAYFSDAFVERNIYVAPRLGSFGFAMLVLAMSVSLARRFNRALADLDSLRRELEQRVEARTRELSGAMHRMEELALTDGLTGLPNRRALLNRAMSGLGTARRKHLSYAVAMADIDHFKAVNDTHGHAAGDQALQRLARLLEASLRASDEVGRWGGEEFLILLPETDEAEALRVAERLRAAVEAEPFVVEGEVALKVTISIGVAALDAPAQTALVLDALIRMADDALYRAKDAGRNRVELARHANPRAV